MPKHEKMLYLGYDPIENIYKTGTSTNLEQRFKKLKYEIGYEIDLVASIPGIDDYMRQYGLETITHPVKHDGRHEWYEDTEENLQIFFDLFKEGNTRRYSDLPDDIQQIISMERKIKLRKYRKIDAYRQTL